MPQIDSNRTLMFLFGRNDQLTGLDAASREIILYDPPGAEIGRVLFYDAGVPIPNDSVANGKIFMNLPVGEYDDTVAFLTKTEAPLYFAFDSAGLGYGFLTNNPA